MLIGFIFLHVSEIKMMSYVGMRSITSVSNLSPIPCIFHANILRILLSLELMIDLSSFTLRSELEKHKEFVLCTVFLSSCDLERDFLPTRLLFLTGLCWLTPYSMSSSSSSVSSRTELTLYRGFVTPRSLTFIFPSMVHAFSTFSNDLISFNFE